METPAGSIAYLVVGHITQDLTPGGPRLGGTATFAALTARALGLQVGVVTAAAPDTPTAPLAGFPTLRLPSGRSTTFENIYQNGRRVQYVRAVAAPIGPAAIPLHWWRAPIVHLAPVAWEVDPSLASRFPTSFVGLTAQGWLREWDGDGRVRQVIWPAAERPLRHAAAVVVSVEDLEGDPAAAAAWARVTQVLVVTDGAAGGTVYWGGHARRFPAPSVPEVDPTGAGDIFAAAFFITLRETGDAWESARFAAVLASASVTRDGLDSIPKPAEIELARVSK